VRLSLGMIGRVGFALPCGYPFYASVVIVIRLVCKCILSDYFWFLKVTVALAFWNNLR
jgi:hypothetical protein